MKSNTWLNAITALRASRAEKPPPGFKTRAEIQKETGKSERRCREMIAQMVMAGLAERRDFKTADGNMVPHYRILKLSERKSGAKQPKRIGRP